jgi:prepilin-type N-terminal cleavage/methylation domain-containing protein
MKLAYSHSRWPSLMAPVPLPAAGQGSMADALPARARSRGFTMIEVALCLAIIGFALVSILAVLPLGMNSQQATRQQTIISQDATMFLEAIRGGAQGMDDLTNYVLAITNYISFYDKHGNLQNSQPYVWGYTYDAASYRGSSQPGMTLTNGARIIGLMSTPEFTAGNLASGGEPIVSILGVPYTSNRVYACVRAFSGVAADKPPQNNDIMRGASFSYRMLCVNAPVAAATNVMAGTGTNFAVFDQELAANLREMRLMFLWPVLPNFSVGLNHEHQNFRADVAGTMILTNDYPNYKGMWLYFCEPQSFTNTTLTP